MAPKRDVPADRTWTQEGVGSGKVTPQSDARNESGQIRDTKIKLASPTSATVTTLDRSQPLVLRASARLSAVPLVARSALEQFSAPPVRTDRETIDIDGFVVRTVVVIVTVVGSSCSADASSESDESDRPDDQRLDGGGSRVDRVAVHYREVSGYLVGSAAFKAVGMGDPHPAGSIPVHLR